MKNKFIGEKFKIVAQNEILIVLINSRVVVPGRGLRYSGIIVEGNPKDSLTNEIMLSRRDLLDAIRTKEEEEIISKIMGR